MDIKLDPTEVEGQLYSKKGKGIVRFFAFIQALKEELKKVSWTNRTELMLSTRLVIGSTFCFGLGIYIVDLVVKGSLDGVGVIFHSIFG